jgi:hypothetical protein
MSVDNKYGPGSGWDLTPDVHQHNNVFYRCWRKKDHYHGWIYTLTHGAMDPPSPTSGGYASFEAAVFAKFGTKI